MAIKFHSRERKAENSAAAVILSSLSTTEHVGNLSKDDDAKFTWDIAAQIESKDGKLTKLGV